MNDKTGSPKLQENLFDAQNRALYIHVPFCVRKCLYCDFISYPYHKQAAEKYLTGLRGEIELRTKSEDNQRWKISTVFIGGGTPTCLSTGLLLEIIKLIKKHFILSLDSEFTVEANPGTVDQAKLLVLRRAGVNRISLGAQSCSDTTLHTLGRIHTHEETVAAVRQIRQAGFENINLDLIFEVPGQTRVEWQQCLEQVMNLHPEHISAYALQLEAGTPLKAMVDAGHMAQSDEDTRLSMYHDAIHILNDAGFYQYEISNFARPGHECLNNLIYWHNGEYLGLGPAAHSRIKSWRTANEGDLSKYNAMLDAEKLPLAWSEPITPENDIFETIFLGLRMISGLDLNRFRERFGRSLESVYPGLTEQLIEKDLLELRGNYLRLTTRGLVVANEVMVEFVPCVT